MRSGGRGRRSSPQGCRPCRRRTSARSLCRSLSAARRASRSSRTRAVSRRCVRAIRSGAAPRRIGERLERFTEATFVLAELFSEGSQRLGLRTCHAQSRNISSQRNISPLHRALTCAGPKLSRTQGRSLCTARWPVRNSPLSVVHTVLERLAARSNSKPMSNVARKRRRTE